ncbi:hypothetical protein PAHAL_3G475800 [Panicum hallii]|uniref:Uncharacterized protein n=1 Tax=Panicum hallii TaxID=206008 RepID=A0A2S3HEU9_9POAL|nr:hypothetical protein PAHAL_3G475800 [Panicum hallii]
MSSIASSMVELLLRRLILGGNKSRAGEGRRPEGGGKFDLGAGSELLFRGLGAAGAEGKALVEGEQSWSAATEEACLLNWMGKLRDCRGLAWLMARHVPRRAYHSPAPGSACPLG